MLYSEYVHKAKKLTIRRHENGTWYLYPEWRDELHRNGLGDIDKLEDSFIDNWDAVEDILKLEVKRRNGTDVKKKFIVDWLYDVITATIEPAMLQEETDFIKNVVEFMKINHETEDKNGEQTE